MQIGGDEASLFVDNGVAPSPAHQRPAPQPNVDINNTVFACVKSNPVIGKAAPVAEKEMRGRAKSDDKKPHNAAFLSRLYQPSDDDDDDEEESPPVSPPIMPAAPGSDVAGLDELGGELEDAALSSSEAAPETPRRSEFSAFDEESLRGSFTPAMSLYEEAKSSYAGSAVRRSGPGGRIEMLWRTPHDFLSFEQFCTVRDSPSPHPPSPDSIGFMCFIADIGFIG